MNCLVTHGHSYYARKLLREEEPFPVVNEITYSFRTRPATSLLKAFRTCLLISARTSSRFIPSVCSDMPRLIDRFPIADFPTGASHGISSGKIPSFNICCQATSNHFFLFFPLSGGRFQSRWKT